jgi:hypothetical protein
MLWPQSKNPQIRMGAMKNYLLTLLQQCSEENFGQEAVEHAIVTGALQLTYNLETDLHQIFDQRSACCDAPPQGELHSHSGLCRQCRNHSTFSTRYDDFIETYQRACREHGDGLVQLYHASGLMEEILRPVSLAQHIPEKETL